MDKDGDKNVMIKKKRQIKRKRPEKKQKKKTVKYIKEYDENNFSSSSSYTIFI